MPVTYHVMSAIDSGGCYGTKHKMSCCRYRGQGRARTVCHESIKVRISVLFLLIETGDLNSGRLSNENLNYRIESPFCTNEALQTGR